MTKKSHNPQMRKLATELGYVCIYWGWIEDAIDELITYTAEIEYEQIAQAIMGNADIRQKIQMAKALAFLRQDANGEWYRETIKLLNTIDNDLRQKRNRYVHAAWYTPKGITTLQKKVVKISKPQAFMPEELKTLDRSPVKIGELQAFRDRLVATVRELVLMLAYQQKIHHYASRRISFLQFRDQAKAAPHPKRTHSKPQSRPARLTK
jgi:hypothetical protein